jgi:two-component system, cell cycle sensor histidine kinase and response regulator CckA
VKKESDKTEIEKRYRLLAENTSDVIWTLDLESFRFTYVSPSVYRMRGLTPEEIMAENLEEALRPEGLESISKILSEELERDKKPGIDPKRSRSMEFQQCKSDGSFIWVEATLNFIRDEHGRPVEILGVSRDINERRRADDEKKTLGAKLLQAQKLEAIATLAGGIAHQFNNALSIIIGRLELLEMDLPEIRANEHLIPVKDTAFRLSRLTSQLLAYARGGKYQAESLSMSRFVRDALPLIQHTVRPSIQLGTDLPIDISWVRVDVTQMQMVLSAILSNASEAIKKTGWIHISCKNIRISSEEAEKTEILSPGKYVRLTVKDDGRGMDDVTKKKIFEPFFSTKFQGRGLGMAAVYGIIKNHNGYIFVDSDPEKGTAVNIYLPAIEVVPKEIPAEPEKKFVSESGKGNILLIEDEETVMDVCRIMLEKLGYNVIPVLTGTEAVDMGERRDVKFDLALLDIKLPDMEATLVYEALKAFRPDLKVIVYSGYSLEDAAEKLLEAGADAFIQKPFSIDDLAKKLNAVL